MIASLPTRLNDVLHMRVWETLDLPVIYAGPDIFSYADLGRGVEAATAILRDAGLRAGYRALLIMENCFAGGVLPGCDYGARYVGRSCQSTAYGA